MGNHGQRSEPGTGRQLQCAANRRFCISSSIYRSLGKSFKPQKEKEEAHHAGSSRCRYHQRSRLLSEISGENIIASDEVKGSITLRLRNVPWDQALDTILRTKGYARVRQNNIIRIAPADVIQAERKAELERRELKAKAEPTAIKLVTVNYAEAADIKSQLEPLMTERGSVQTDERTNTLIVEDVLSNIDRLVMLTRKLDKQTPQVLLKPESLKPTAMNSRNLVFNGVAWAK